MRGTRQTVLAILTILTILMPLHAAAAERGVIIGFHKQPGASEHALLHGLGGKLKHQFTTIRAAAARIPEEALAKIKANPQVAYVEEDAPIALVEPLSGSIEEDNSWGVARVGALALHAQGNFGQGVKIAILDSGIDATHPELATSYRGGVNLVYPESPDSPADDSWDGHGTHVAGILAAADDGSGVVGIAPAADLYAVKIIGGSGSGTISDLIAGLEWTIANQIDIANISLGTNAPSLALEQACQAAFDAGVLMVAAAGNTRNSGGAVQYPAAYAPVIAVSATAPDDSAVWIAAAGPKIELAAPGGNIYSTVPGGGYGVLTGTSQAAPHVSGVAALLMAAGINDLDGNGTADHRDLRLQLQQTTRDLGNPGRDDTFGFGLAQAVAAPQMINVRLSRLKGRIEESLGIIDLAAGRYEIRIANDSLYRIQIAVFDQAGYRADLSESVRFRTKAPTAAGIPLVTGEGLFKVVFVPEGPINGFADITIRAY
ncbi:MAG: S8 family peptidase [Desulfuromonadales bacterium]|nr:S8 family peptidase [Desulfuromonadales bacterium]